MTCMAILSDVHCEKQATIELFAARPGDAVGPRQPSIRLCTTHFLAMAIGIGLPGEQPVAMLYAAGRLR